MKGHTKVMARMRETKPNPTAPTPVPRVNRKSPVTRDRGRWFLYAFFYAVVVLVAMILFFAQREEDALAREGRTTQAQVFSKYTIDSRSPSYTLKYTFTLDGQVHEGKGDVDESTYQKMAKGSLITITYLPSDLRVQRMGKVTQAGTVADRNFELILVGCLALGMTGVIALTEWLNRRFRA